MPITVQWNTTNPSILHWTFTARWTWEEYLARCETVRPDILRHTQSMNVIFDMSQSGRIPAGSFTSAREALMRSRKHLHTVVIVASNPMIQTLYGVFVKVNDEVLRQSHIRLHLTKTLDDAYTLVNKHTSTC